MCEENDSTLIARAKEEPKAFGTLYERYVDKIYRYICYRVGADQDAEDLTARTFYRALDHFQSYEDRGAPFSAWLYRIAHNLVANWHRDNSRRKMIPLDDLVLRAPKGKGPAAKTEKVDEEDVLLKAVRRLAPDRQQLIILKHVEGMTNAEIGEVMERTEGAIKSLYHRALVALREDLADEWEELT
ncbi:MAG: sigma-70 family RNA polymerase sigma factor [Anaerolineae bacterium]|jgi:RNA polymerase sigma-70 factor (ECF subfamily)